MNRVPAASDRAFSYPDFNKRRRRKRTGTILFTTGCLLVFTSRVTRRHPAKPPFASEKPASWPRTTRRLLRNNKPQVPQASRVPKHNHRRRCLGIKKQHCLMQCIGCRLAHSGARKQRKYPLVADCRHHTSPKLGSPHIMSQGYQKLNSLLYVFGFSGEIKHQAFRIYIYIYCIFV